jgi:hypothetical protein
VKILRLALSVAGASLLWAPAHATETVYNYHIEHSSYGDIGTYSNTVRTDGDRAEVRSQLHVIVKILGMVVHREDADRTEIWKGDRLVRFDGVTDTNGKEIRIHGEAQGDNFVVTGPEGTNVVPGDVHPSNPWSPMVFNTDMMLSPKNGRVEKVSVAAASNYTPVIFDGQQKLLKRFDVVGQEHDKVWLDEKGTPYAFQTVQEGETVDFVMTGQPLTLADRGQSK